VTRVAMLTGDHAAAARATGEAVGVDEVRASQMPEDKVAAVEQVAKSARTAKASQEVAEFALSLVEHASQLNRLDDAARLADISISAAQRAKNATLLRDAQEAKQKVETMSEKTAGGVKKKRDPNE